MALSEGTSLLALGGIGAAITAGWSHIKGIFARISSLIVITVHYDNLTSQAVIEYLSLNYNLLPSGIQYIKSRGYPVKNRHYYPWIPFLTPANNTIRYNKRQILFVSGKQDSIIIRSLRGMIEFKEFTKLALKSYESKNNCELGNVNRYRVVQMIGREKGVYAAQKEDKSEKSQGEMVNHSSGDSYDINTQYMQSFMYPESYYKWNNKINPFENLYYDTEVEKYINQARQWFKMGDWYTNRSIPWRRGWLLHGKPGCGKSELAKALAQELGIPIYVFHLSTMSDQEYMAKLNDVSFPAVVLLEDLDNVYKGRENITEHKSLSFDCLLNSLSGVSSPNGMFLIVTTNRIDYIDPALGISQGSNGISTRPGRLDTVIKLGTMNAKNREKMAKRVLKDWPQFIADIVKIGEGVTPVQFQEMLVQYAFQMIADPTNTKLPEFTLPDQIFVKNSYEDTGYGSLEPVEERYEIQPKKLAQQQVSYLNGR